MAQEVGAVSPLTHLLISYTAGGKKAVLPGLAPDAPNLLFVFKRQRLPERDWRVKLSRISHSPFVVLALLVASGGASWPYALHWLCDAVSHPPYQWLWPLVRKHDD